MSDLEMPSCCHSTRPKARKRHRCCECWGWIEIGEVYNYLTGIWDGRASTYKTCLECTALREEIEARPGVEAIALKGLYEEVAESDSIRDFTRLMAIAHKRGHELRECDSRWLRQVCNGPAIQCAAIAYNGTFFEGWAHHAIGQGMVAADICTRPFPGGKAQGFITINREFVSREEALEIALACGQVLPGKHQHPSELFSEDLRYDKK